jgi:cell division protein FtsB
VKRGLDSCFYDLEPNQSRVAAYKQKIEQQLSSIKRLEDEIQELKKSPFHSGTVVRETASEPAPSSSNNSSGGVPMRLLLNPAPEPSASPSQTPSSTTGPYVQASQPTTPMLSREVELLRYQHNLEAEMRKLKDENRTLQALISILNSMDDREQAQQMAQEIYTRGVSDDLLSKAQHLVANQVRKPLVLNLQTQAIAPQRPGRAAENSQRSTP